MRAGPRQSDLLPALAQVAAVRNNCVACLDRTGHNLRQERLVGHVWQWVDQGHFGFTVGKMLLELPCGVEAGVTAADDENLRRGGFS